MSHLALFKLGKFVIFIIAVLFFVGNSIVIFQHFISRKKVTTSEDIPNEALVPPAIFVCREKAFTDEKTPMAKLDDFLNNTLNLNYSMYSKYDNIRLFNNGARNNPTIIIGNETITNAPKSVYARIFRIEYVYSFSRGLCYKFRFLSKVNIYSLIDQRYYLITGMLNRFSKDNNIFTFR